jgi:8-hydroxy-5-deazaflavin:NADPH oxidoreductase
MIIAVVGGSGEVGSTLGARLAAAGHAVTIAARDPGAERVTAAVAKVRAAVRAPGSAAGATVRAACDAADVVVVCVPGQPAAEGWAPIVAAMGPCAGKAVIDVTNPLTAWPALELSVDRNSTSATELLAGLLPECGGVFKAFNTVGVPVLADPKFGGRMASMLYAGPSAGEGGAAFKAVTTLIRDVGFEPVYVGPQRQARNLESVAEMWIHMALRYKDLPYQQDHDSKAFGWSVLFR